MTGLNGAVEGLFTSVKEEVVDCIVVSKGPSLEDLNAVILPFASPYMWEREPFLLKRHEDAPCPWIGQQPEDTPQGQSIFWAQFRHDGSIEDEWFTVFLLKELTSTFKGEVIAQVWSADGQFMLIDAAELLPKWVDSSKHGSLDSIASNRVWLHEGRLQLIPLRSDTSHVDLSVKRLTFYTATQAVFNSSVNTEAPARIQEHLSRNHLSLYPAAIRKQQHRARVLMPRAACCVLMKKPKLAADAARAFLNRSPQDMQSAMKKEDGLWMGAKGTGNAGNGNEHYTQMDTCTVLLRRSHYAALVGTTFAAPKGGAMPAPGTPSHKAAMLGMKLSLGLQIYADRVNAELGPDGVSGSACQHGRMKESDAGQRFMKVLQKQGYFRDSIEGSQEYERLYGLAEEAWNASRACRDAQLTVQLQAAELQQAQSSSITNEELRKSARMAEDCDKWMQDDFDLRMGAYGAELDDTAPTETDQSRDRSGATNVDGTSAAQPDGGSGPGGIGGEIEAEDLLGRLSQFMEGAAGLTGAKPQPSSFSLDVNALMALLKPPAGLQEGDEGSGDDDMFSEENYSEEPDSDDDSNFDENEFTVASNPNSRSCVDSAAVCTTSGAAGTTCAKNDVTQDRRGDDSACVLLGGDKADTTRVRASQNEGEEPEGSFMAEYMEHLDKELNENATEKLKGVDVDLSCVADLLKSVEEGAGQPGAAEGLIGMLGMRLPKTTS